MGMLPNIIIIKEESSMSTTTILSLVGAAIAGVATLVYGLYTKREESKMMREQNMRMAEKEYIESRKRVRERPQHYEFDLDRNEWVLVPGEYVAPPVEHVYHEPQRPVVIHHYVTPPQPQQYYAQPQYPEYNHGYYPNTYQQAMYYNDDISNYVPRHEVPPPGSMHAQQMQYPTYSGYPTYNQEIPPYAPEYGTSYSSQSYNNNVVTPYNNHSGPEWSAEYWANFSKNVL
jgi:FtsZ-interacting cell division protein ZipA